MAKYRVSGMYKLEYATTNKGKRTTVSSRISTTIEADDEDNAINYAIIELLDAKDIDIAMCSFEFENHTLKAIDVRDLAMDARENLRIMKAIGAPSLFDEIQE